jgi:hypothetical protein
VCVCVILSFCVCVSLQKFVISPLKSASLNYCLKWCTHFLLSRAVSFNCTRRRSASPNSRATPHWGHGQKASGQRQTSPRCFSKNWRSLGPWLSKSLPRPTHRRAFSGIVINLATCQTPVLILRTARISGHIWSPVCTRVRSLFSAARSLKLVCRISTARPAFGKSHFDPDRFQKPNVTRPSRFSSQKIINSIKYSCSSEHIPPGTKKNKKREKKEKIIYSHNYWI